MQLTEDGDNIREQRTIRRVAGGIIRKLCRKCRPSGQFYPNQGIKPPFLIFSVTGKNAANPNGFASILTQPQHKISLSKSNSSLNALAKVTGGRPMKKVGIIMGSDSDLPIIKKATDMLKSFDVPFEVHIYSAHRTPLEAKQFSENARKNGFGVIIAAAGMAAHLAGAVAANTTLPVIGIPCKSSNLDGMDALLSTVQMPTGIPVATVAINGGGNAALLAMQILAVEDAALAEKLDNKRKSDAAAVLQKDAKVMENL